MLILGLTGGIATGKSTVSKFLAERQVPIVDADIIARQVVEPGTKGYAAIVDAFQATTPDLLLPDKTLNRPALGRRIFNDAEARRTLNGITHPAVKKAMLAQIARHYLTGHALVVLDVPLLFEGGLDGFCGKTVVVACSDALQMKRLMARDNHLSKDDAESRVRSQMSIAEKKKLADLVIENDASLEELESKVDAMLEAVRPYWIVGMVEWLIPPVGISMGFWTVLIRYLTKPSRSKL